MLILYQYQQMQLILKVFRIFSAHEINFNWNYIGLQFLFYFVESIRINSLYLV